MDSEPQKSAKKSTTNIRVKPYGGIENVLESIKEVEDKTQIEETKKECLDEDYSIAEEFKENEQHISVDLAKRDGEIPIITSQPSNIPFRNINLRQLGLEFNRRRSVTINIMPRGRGLFSRAESQKGALLIKNSLHLQSIASKEKENISKYMHKENALQDTKKVMKERINCGHNIDLNRPSPKDLQRLRTISIDSYGAYMSEVGQRNLLAKDLRGSNVTPSNMNYKILDSVQSGGLRDKFSVLLNKGQHKFSNTAQAQPKAPHKRSDIEDMSKITDRSGQHAFSGRKDVPKARIDMNVFSILGRLF